MKKTILASIILSFIFIACSSKDVEKDTSYNKNEQLQMADKAHNELNNELKNNK